MLVIGLTGSIGSGKSTVRDVLARKGALIIDADAIGHEVYRPGMPAWKDIVAAWGEGVLLPTRDVDRKKLGAIVFQDPQELQRLNGIVHPRMWDLIQQRLAEARKKSVPVVVFEAAILFESGWEVLVDEVWCVTSSEEVAIKRLAARNGLTAEQVRARMRNQLPVDEKARRSQVVIENNGALKDLEAAVEKVWQERVVKGVR